MTAKTFIAAFLAGFPFVAAVRADTLIADTGQRILDIFGGLTGTYESSVYETPGGTLDFLFNWQPPPAGPNIEEFVAVYNFNCFQVSGQPTVDPSHIFDYTPDPSLFYISTFANFGFPESVLLKTNATHFDANGSFVFGVDYRISTRTFAEPAFEPDLSGQPAPATPQPSSACGGMIVLGVLGAMKVIRDAGRRLKTRPSSA